MIFLNINDTNQMKKVFFFDEIKLVDHLDGRLDVIGRRLVEVLLTCK